MRNKIILILSCLFLAMPYNALARKTVKISATPDNAKIYVDGNYMGDGVVEATVTKDFIAVKLECEGYVTVNTKIHKSDKRNAVSFVLKQDPISSSSTPSGLVNKYFTIDVSESLYTVSDGKIDPSRAWKLIHQILLNYFDEIESTDINSGFIQTPWKYKKYAEAEQIIRTRASFRDISVDENFVMQVKISVEVSPMMSANNELSYKPIQILLNEYSPMIGELQSRVAKPSNQLFK